MKRILMTLAMLVFASSIDAAPRTPRTNKRTALMAKESANSDMMHALPFNEVEHQPAVNHHANPKHHIVALRQQIKDAHAAIERHMQDIQKWTKELAPLEVQAHHAKASRTHTPQA